VRKTKTVVLARYKEIDLARFYKTIWLTKAEMLGMTNRHTYRLIPFDPLIPAERALPEEPGFSDEAIRGALRQFVGHADFF
jgi:hypothetical protein